MNTEDIKTIGLIVGPVFTAFITWLLTRRQREIESIAILNSAITNLSNEVVSLHAKNMSLQTEIVNLKQTISELRRKYNINGPNRNR